MNTGRTAPLLEGESLGARLQREPVPLDDALRYADELLDVLAAAFAVEARPRYP